MGSIRYRAIVSNDQAGKRVDQVAADLFSGFSRNRLKLWIQQGDLTLSGRTVEPKTKVREGDELTLNALPEPVVEVYPEPISLDFVHEDSACAVINKPAGLVVHPGAGNPSGTMQNALLHWDERLASVPRAGIVHRIDKETSGLLVVARTLEAHQALVKQLEKHEVERTYEGICQRVLTGGGKINAPIGRHPKDRLRMAVIEGTRPAITNYRLLERFRAHTHVRIQLETGRTHQIRVHFAHIKAPLVGDPLYGKRPLFPVAPEKNLKQKLQQFPRQALHAKQLAFKHPISGKLLSFSSSIPEDMSKLLQALRGDVEAAQTRQ
ncbi:MAG: 23S rRNA pseudouridine(1911/1915/1917) synthase RluD [Rhodospirillaceae bacterium]|nr:23S rRNA pseudouridine(1911/1915/1917) synthase RluD [Rhodospirillaceae bacterium]